MGCRNAGAPKFYGYNEFQNFPEICTTELLNIY